MKLGKGVWVFLAIGILVILVISLGMAYSQQGREQSRLNQELSQAQLILGKYKPEELPSQQRETQSRLAQAEAQLRAAKANLRQSIESIEVTDTLFEVAENCSVEISEISSPGPTSKTLEGLTCPVLSLTVKVEGDVPNLINFILKLSKKLPTGVVDSVKIDVPEVTEEEIEESAKPSANLKLRIHTYEGD